MMCDMQNVRRYQSLSTGAESLESQLQGFVAEYLNAEIVLQTVTDVSMAISWLYSTFMYVRVRLSKTRWLQMLYASPSAEPMKIRPSRHWYMYI